MSGIDLPEEVLDRLRLFQRIEITEAEVYRRLSRMASGGDSEVLLRIADDEVKHYNQWRRYTKTDFKPNMLTVLFYSIIARIFGYTFAIKVMERKEAKAQRNYGDILDSVPEARELLEEEARHEEELIGLIDEERLRYIGSMILGVNDAIVELTGALAGLTLALQNTILVGVAAFITGVAAALSMGASEYLRQKSEMHLKPLKAALYTGIAYLLSVLFLVSPYFILSNSLHALALTLLNAIIIIGVFTSYISITRDLGFRRQFTEMALLSLSIAFLTFLMGLAIRIYFNIEV